MAERLQPPGCAWNFEDAGPRRITLPFSRQQIADVLGLTIETVSRQFTRFKNERLIDLPSRRDVILLDHEALTAEAG
jgi:CRP/FNR family transcriptional regulator